MALEKKSVHVRIAPDLHEQLSILAELEGKDMSELLATFCEKAIVGEFYAFNIVKERLLRVGLAGINRR